MEYVEEYFIPLVPEGQYDPRKYFEIIGDQVSFYEPGIPGQSYLGTIYHHFDCYNLPLAIPSHYLEWFTNTGVEMRFRLSTIDSPVRILSDGTHRMKVDMDDMFDWEKDPINQKMDHHPDDQRVWAFLFEFDEPHQVMLFKLACWGT